MKNILKTMMVMILIFVSDVMTAQATQLEYTLDSSSIEFSGQTLSITSTISRIGSDLKWTQQNNGTINITDFQINQSTEDWNQSTSIGTLTHNVFIDGQEVGTFVLVGTIDGLTAVLTINVDGGQQQYTFLVNGINYH